MVLSTARTIIRPLLIEDIPIILEMYQEPDSFKYIAPHKNKSLEYYQNFLESKIKLNRNEIGFWVVLSKENKHLIGTVNLNQFMDTSMAHVGCHLSRKFWNKGFATELMNALIDYGFSVRKLNEIYAIIEVDHFVSIKLFEKLFFKIEAKKTILGSDLEFYKLTH